MKFFFWITVSPLHTFRPSSNSNDDFNIVRMQNIYLITRGNATVSVDFLYSDDRPVENIGTLRRALPEVSKTAISW